MNEIPPKHETPPQPVALTPEKETIRVSQEEYLDDMAGPSMDKSEYEATKGKQPSLRPATDGDESPRNEQPERFVRSAGRWFCIAPKWRFERDITALCLSGLPLTVQG